MAQFQQTDDGRYIVWKTEIIEEGKIDICPAYWTNEEELKKSDPFVPAPWLSKRKITRLLLTTTEMRDLLLIVP